MCLHHCNSVEYKKNSRDASRGTGGTQRKHKGMVSLPEKSFKGEVLVKKVMRQMGGKGQGRMVHAKETV